VKYLPILKTFLLSASCLLAVFASWNYETKKSRSFEMFFNQNYSPYILGTLNNLKQNFILDTGGCFHTRLDESLIPQLSEPKESKKYSLMNCEGRITECQEFYLEDTKLLDVTFERLFYVPTPKEFWQHGFLSGEITPITSLKINTNSEAIYSLIGHKLLDGLNFCFDFRKNTFRLYKNGLTPLFNFPYGFLGLQHKIPLHYDPDLGLVCEIDTNVGHYKFLVDTGFPITAFKDHDSLKDLVNAESIGALPFEKFDGILGMDFFCDKVVFFDMENYFMCLK
jgi:hypothetical protein